MKIRRKHKHGRRHIREARLRHEAKLMRLALIYGMQEPWRTIWVKKASNKYSPRSWCNYWDREDRPIQERKLDLYDQEDELWNC